jgi:hypothetical protein
MFELYVSKSRLAKYDLTPGRIAYLLSSSLPHVIIILIFIWNPTDKPDAVVAVGFAGIAIFLSIALSIIGIFVTTLVSVKRQPRLFWVCSTLYAAMPVLGRIAISFWK